MTEFLGNGPPQYEDLSSHTFSWQGPFSMKVKAVTHFSTNPQEKIPGGFMKPADWLVCRSLSKGVNVHQLHIRAWVIPY